MHEKSCGRRVAVCSGRAIAFDGRKAQQHELSVAFDRFDLTAGKMLFKRSGIIDEICFSEPNRHDFSADDRAPQASRYCFDFGKFRHEGSETK
jgi:hypothetical protein